MAYRRDMKQQVLDIKGKPIQRRDPDTGEPVEGEFNTYEDYALVVLLNDAREAARPADPLATKKECFKVAAKIERAGPDGVELEPADVTLIMKRIADFYPSIIVGRMSELIEADPSGGDAERPKAVPMPAMRRPPKG